MHTAIRTGLVAAVVALLPLAGAKADSVADTKADPPSVVQTPKSKAALYVLAAIMLAVAAVAARNLGRIRAAMHLYPQDTNALL